MSLLNVILIGISIVSLLFLGFGAGRFYEMRTWAILTDLYESQLQESWKEEERLRKELEEIL